MIFWFRSLIRNIVPPIALNVSAEAALKKISQGTCHSSLIIKVNQQHDLPQSCFDVVGIQLAGQFSD